MKGGWTRLGFQGIVGLEVLSTASFVRALSIFVR